MGAERSPWQEYAGRAKRGTLIVQPLLPNTNAVARLKSDVGDGSGQGWKWPRDHPAIAIGYLEQKVIPVDDDEITGLWNKRHDRRSVVYRRDASVSGALIARLH